MNKITDEIKLELIKRCDSYYEQEGYDFWNDHIKYVVKNALDLAHEYNADEEIVELGALLHDIAQVTKFGPSEAHHIYGAKIAEELLSDLGYPMDRIKRVQACILNHRGSIDRPRESIEEECVADADVMAHFDCIPSLFSLVYKTKKMSIEDGKSYVKSKLERDYNKLSLKTREKLKDRYDNIVKLLFVEK
ncbi:MAG: HD domain-containing protein [Bacilli bacterium]|nr:HD domain-containing protein [Bacilli bacterium]